MSFTDELVIFQKELLAGQQHMANVARKAFLMKALLRRRQSFLAIFEHSATTLQGGRNSVKTGHPR